MATAREMAAQHLGAAGSEQPLHGSDEEAAHLRDAKRHFARLKKIGPYWRQAA
jgi:hypothetical protein